jgi:hypothetical protein
MPIPIRTGETSSGNSCLARTPNGTGKRVTPVLGLEGSQCQGRGQHGRQTRHRRQGHGPRHVGAGQVRVDLAMEPLGHAASSNTPRVMAG